MDTIEAVNFNRSKNFFNTFLIFFADVSPELVFYLFIKQPPYFYLVCQLYSHIDQSSGFSQIKNPHVATVAFGHSKTLKTESFFIF